MSIFEKYTGSSSYYTEDELDRLENPEKYGYTQETYDAFVSQTQQRAENRAIADQAEMDALDSYVSSGDISFSGRSGQTSDATAGLSGFMGNFGFPAPFQQGSGDTGDVMQSAPDQVDQGIASLPDMSESSRDDSPQGEIAYYDQNTWLDGLKNMAFGSFGALGKMTYGVLTNQPNTPYVVQDLETGTIRMSDGTPITAPSFPTSPAATTFAAPESFTQGLTPSAPSPLSSPTITSPAGPVMSRAATPSPVGDPFAFEDARMDPMRTDFARKASSGVVGIDPSEVSKGFDPFIANYDAEEIARIVNDMAALGNLPAAPTLASEVITGGGDTGAISTYTGYDDYTAADFSGGSDDLGAGDFTGGLEM